MLLWCYWSKKVIWDFAFLSLSRDPWIWFSIQASGENRHDQVEEDKEQQDRNDCHIKVHDYFKEPLEEGLFVVLNENSITICYYSVEDRILTRHIQGALAFHQLRLHLILSLTILVTPCDIIKRGRIEKESFNNCLVVSKIAIWGIIVVVVLDAKRYSSIFC